MKFTTTIFSLSVAVASALALVANPSVPPPDNSKVWVQSVQYGGSGCPQGTAAVTLSPDQKTFTVVFDKFTAAAGPAYRATDARKNCQLTVGLHYPQGYQYSVLSADYRGYVDLANGVKGTQKSTYYFAGSTAQASTETVFNGPVKKDYLLSDTVPFSSVVWSPCGASSALNVNSQVRVDNSAYPRRTGVLTTDSVDGKVTFVCGIQWRTCT